jgi:diguanylate cyclase (GGDEF)-like protein
MLQMKKQNVHQKVSRVSVSLFLSLVSGFIFLLFVLFLVLTQNRLNDFKKIVFQVSGESLPALVKTAQTYSQINHLLYLTESLSRVVSEAQRLNTWQQIEESFSQLRLLNDAKNDNSYQGAQLVALMEESSELNALTKQRIELQHQLLEKQQDLYKLYQQLSEASTSETATEEQGFSSWYLHSAEMIALSGRLILLNRVSQLKQADLELQQHFSLLEQSEQQLVQAERAKAAARRQEMAELVLGKQGILTLRQQQLSVHASATGRSNFLRNLMQDYARQAEQGSYRAAEQVTTDIQSAEQKLQLSSVLLQVATLVFLLGLAWAIFWVHQVVVRRLDQLGQNVQHLQRGEKPPFHITGGDEIADISNSFNYFASTVDKQQHELQQLSLTDSLTGLANRRGFSLQFRSALESAQRRRSSMAVLMLDVDCFKAFNDHYGHQKGDYALVQCAAVLNKVLNRSTDIIARYGGEEFVCVLPDYDEPKAAVITEKILQAFAEQNIEHQHNSAAPYVTVSIGVTVASELDPTSDELLLQQADHALYQAKATGRNRVVFFAA